MPDNKTEHMLMHSKLLTERDSMRQEFVEGETPYLKNLFPHSPVVHVPLNTYEPLWLFLRPGKEEAPGREHNISSVSNSDAYCSLKIKSK